MKISVTKLYLWLAAIILAGLSFTHAYVFNVDNREPFGVLNLKQLIIKPNTAHTGIILDGETYTIKIDPNHENPNSGQIRVYQICDESGQNCKNVSELFTGGESSGWMGAREAGVRRLTPANTNNGLWIQPKIAIGPDLNWLFDDNEYKLRVEGSAKLSGDLVVSGGNITVSTNSGKIKVHQICDENGENCKDVSQLGNGVGGGGNTNDWWTIGYRPVSIDPVVNVYFLYPENTGYNVWIGEPSNDASNYKLGVNGQTKLSGDLTINSDTVELSGSTLRIKTNEGKIRVNKICNESGTNCKTVDEIIQLHDISWIKYVIYDNGNTGILMYPIDTGSSIWLGKDGIAYTYDEVSQYKLWVTGTTRLDGDLILSGDKVELSGDVLRIKTNDGKLKVHEICDENGENCKPISELYTGNGDVVYGGGGDGYWKVGGNGVLTTSGNYDMNLNQSLSVANDLTVNDGNIIVGKNDGKVNVSQICDKDGSNCRTVSQITTGNNYWERTNDGSDNITMSNSSYGLKLSTQYNTAKSQVYSFEIKDGDRTKGKLKIANNGVELLGNTTLNNDLTVDGTTIANSGVSITTGGLTVTGVTTLNNGLIVYNGLINLNTNGMIALNGTYINLHGVQYIMLRGKKKFTDGEVNMDGNVNITGATTITGQLNVRVINNNYEPPVAASLSFSDIGLVVTGNTEVTNNLNVGGATTLHDLLVSGSMEVRNDSFSITKVVPGTSYIVFNVNTELLPGAPATITADGNTTIRGNTEIKGNAIISSGDTTVKNKLYVGNDNNNCYESGNVNCYASDSSLDEISQIRFVPKTFDNQKQISDVKKCDRSIEGTLVYWRDKNQDGQAFDQEPRLSICMCALRVLGSQQRPNVCEWKDIVSLQYP